MGYANEQKRLWKENPRVIDPAFNSKNDGQSFATKSLKDFISDLNLKRLLELVCKSKLSVREHYKWIGFQQKRSLSLAPTLIWKPSNKKAHFVRAFIRSVCKLTEIGQYRWDQPLDRKQTQNWGNPRRHNRTNNTTQPRSPAGRTPSGEKKWTCWRLGTILVERPCLSRVVATLRLSLYVRMTEPGRCAFYTKMISAFQTFSSTLPPTDQP